MLYRRNHLIYRLLDAFFRHWAPFVVAVVGVTSVVAAVLLLRSDTYTAAANVRVIPEDEVSSVMGFTKQSWITAASLHSSRFGDLMTNTRPGGFVSTVLQEAKLQPPINPDGIEEDPRVKEFTKRVYVGPISNEVFSIGLVWPDEKECVRLVTALRKNYFEYAAQSRETQAVATKQYLDSEIDRYRKMLKSAESALVEYKMTHSGQLPDAQIASLEQFANLRMERDYLAITAQDNALKSAALAQRLAQIKPTAIMEQTIGNDPLRLELRELEAQRRLHLKKYTETSTVVKEDDQQIAALKKQIASQQSTDPTQQRNVTETKLQDNPEYMDLTQQLTEARISEQTQKARMALLDKKLGEYQVRIAALPAAERELTEKTRDYKLLQGQFEDLLKRRQQAELKARLDRVTSSAALAANNNIYAEKTTGRTKKMIMMAGSLFVGIVIGFGIILLREWMDPSLRYETDAARLLGVPVLAGLPDHPNLRFPAISAKKVMFAGRREIPPHT